MPDATLVITTKNRKEELRNALLSAVRQRGCNFDILVIDDGSTDGTSEMLRQEFPGITVDRAEISRGYIVQRNRAARLATSPIIFSIDDDAAFPSADTIAQSLAEFTDARIGALAIPFINVKQDMAVRQLAPDSKKTYVASTYIGTAHALRRELFPTLGGYRDFLGHQGEESDYCIRMLDAGYVVRVGSADPIHHYESPRREWRRMDLFGRRNDILFGVCNVPLVNLPAHLVGTTLNGLRCGLRVGRPGRMCQGLFQGYIEIVKFRKERKPVRPATYKLYRMIKRQGIVPLDSILPLLPSPQL